MELDSNLSAEEIMTKDPIIIEPDIFAIEALKLMEDNSKKQSVSVLPVINVKSEFLGILRLHDLVQAGLKENKWISFSFPVFHDI